MIYWSLEDENQNNLNTIATWWTGLEGKIVQRIKHLGAATGTTGDVTDHGGLSSMFRIQNPTLQHRTLSYQNHEESLQTYQVKQLQLDTENQRIRIITTNDEVYTFDAK